jgi:hypothetical protein
MTNLSDREKLKEAIKRLKDNMQWSKEGWTSMWVADAEIFIALAQSHLSANEELPERREYAEMPNDDPSINVHYDGFCKGFNSCLDQVTPIVARLKEENEELRKELKNYTGCKMGEVVKSTTA